MSWTTDPWTPKWQRRWWFQSSGRPPLDQIPNIPEDHPGWPEESHGYLMLYRHCVKARSQHHAYEYYRWCEARDLDYQWSTPGPVFRFRNPDDAILFKLTWG